MNKQGKFIAKLAINNSLFVFGWLALMNLLFSPAPEEIRTLKEHAYNALLLGFIYSFMLAALHSVTIFKKYICNHEIIEAEENVLSVAFNIMLSFACLSVLYLTNTSCFYQFFELLEYR